MDTYTTSIIWSIYVVSLGHALTFSANLSRIGSIPEKLNRKKHAKLLGKYFLLFICSLLCMIGTVIYVGGLLTSDSALLLKQVLTIYIVLLAPTSGQWFVTNRLNKMEKDFKNRDPGYWI